MTKGGRASWILAIAAHVLAWVASLPLAVGLVLWPFFRGGHGEDFGVLIAVFFPVVLTGLPLLTVLAARRNRDISLLAARVRVVPILLVLWGAALLLFGFCALALFSVGILFLPAALASLSLAIVFSFSPKVAPGGK